MVITGTMFRIRLLKSTFGNDVGDILSIKNEDAVGAIYYYDGFRRWSCLTSEEEGIYWERIGKK